MVGVAAMLRARPCLWLGEPTGFLSPEHVALDAGALGDESAPALYVGAAPAPLRAYEPLLRALGVRETLGASDLLHANSCLARDFASAALPHPQLAACLAQLRAAQTFLGSAEGAGLLASGLSLPDSGGVLCPTVELTYDDAPWMSAALRDRPADEAGGLRFVHDEVGAELAEKLGARSLRYMMLLEEKLTDALPCPAAAQARPRARAPSCPHRWAAA